MQALCCSAAQAADAITVQRWQPEVTISVLQRSSGSRRNSAEVAVMQSLEEHMPAAEVLKLSQGIGAAIQTLAIN